MSDMLLDRRHDGRRRHRPAGIRRMIEADGYNGPQEVEIFSRETGWKRPGDTKWCGPAWSGSGRCAEGGSVPRLVFDRLTMSYCGPDVGSENLMVSLSNHEVRRAVSFPSAPFGHIRPQSLHWSDLPEGRRDEVPRGEKATTARSCRSDFPSMGEVAEGRMRVGRLRRSPHKPSESDEAGFAPPRRRYCRAGF